jgi:dehydrogenase/reductase SDR family member 12
MITGATSGIGYAAAVALARHGAAVHFLARDRGRAERARQGIAAASGSRAISYGLADLEDLATVRAFAGDFTPFLLTRLLMPALLTAAPSRVITVSSGGMYTQRLDLATRQMPASRYRGVAAYVRAKRARVALSHEWARRLAGTGVAFHAMHPGWVGTPGIAASLPTFHRLSVPILLSPEQGADTIVWLAAMPAERLGSGRFWHDRRPRPEYPLPWTHGHDPAAARKLWDGLAVQTAPGASGLAWAGLDEVADGHVRQQRLPWVRRGWLRLLPGPGMGGFRLGRRVPAAEREAGEQPQREEDGSGDRGQAGCLGERLLSRRRGRCRAGAGRQLTDHRTSALPDRRHQRGAIPGRHAGQAG